MSAASATPTAIVSYGHADPGWAPRCTASATPIHVHVTPAQVQRGHGYKNGTLCLPIDCDGSRPGWLHHIGFTVPTSQRASRGMLLCEDAIMVTCFVSYTSADAAWAEWIADTLRSAGHEVLVQATDFLPGMNFVAQMQDGASRSDHTIVVLSKAFLASSFGFAEFAAAFAQDPEGRSRRVIPVAIDDVNPPGLWKAIVRISLENTDEAEATRRLCEAVVPAAPKRPAFPTAVRDVTEPKDAHTSPSPDVDTWRLARTNQTMVGREAQLQLMDEAWGRSAINILQIEGWAGSGKSTLLSNWLANQAAVGYGRAIKVFGWSFADNAGDIATSDALLTELGTFLGLPSRGADPWQHARGLLEVLRQTRCLLALDGIEVLQITSGQESGILREGPIRMLVRELAAQNAGLLITTSRLTLPDLGAYVDKTVKVISLPELADDDCIALFRSTGVDATDEEVLNLSKLVDNHPLSLRLLSGYISQILDGNIRALADGDLAEIFNGSVTAQSLLKGYEEWYKGRGELQMLHLVSLFSQPCSLADILETYRQTYFASPLIGARQGLAMLSQLTKAGLLRRTANDYSEHPLVRHYFQKSFLVTSQEEYASANLILRDRIIQNAQTSRPNANTIQQLLFALWHSCAAGDYRYAFQRIYRELSGGNTHYVRDVLGAPGLDYIATTNLLEFSNEVVLSESEKAWLLKNQSLDLRMMGRTDDSILALRQSVDLLGPRDAEAYSSAQRHLAYMEFCAGNGKGAADSARQAEQVLRTVAAPPLEAIAAKVNRIYILGHQRADLMGRIGPILLTVADRLAASSTEYGPRATFNIAIYRLADVVSRAHSVALIDHQTFESIKVTLDGIKSAPVGAALIQGLGGLTSAALELGGRVMVPASTTLEVATGRLQESGQRPWVCESYLLSARCGLAQGDITGARNFAEKAAGIAIDDHLYLKRVQADLLMCIIDEANAGVRFAHRRLQISDRARDGGFEMLAICAALDDWGYI